MAQGALPTTKNDKVRTNSSDQVAGFLEDKLESTDGSVTFAANAAGDKMDVVAIGGGGFVSKWTKYTVAFDHASLDVASGTIDVEIDSALTAGSIITWVKKKTTVAFAGTGITNAKLTIKYGSSSETTDNYDLDSAVTTTNGFSAAPQWTQIGDQGSADTIKARFTFTGANGEDLTAGSVDIWIKTEVLI